MLLLSAIYMIFFKQILNILRVPLSVKFAYSPPPSDPCHHPPVSEFYVSFPLNECLMPSKRLRLIRQLCSKTRHAHRRLSLTSQVSLSRFFHPHSRIYSTFSACYICSHWRLSRFDLSQKVIYRGWNSD